MDKYIGMIAERAISLLGPNAHLDKIDIIMDLFYCIRGGCELRLSSMYHAKDGDLMHDIIGINKHLNHETYKLENGFWPRFAGRD